MIGIFCWKKQLYSVQTRYRFVNFDKCGGQKTLYKVLEIGVPLNIAQNRHQVICQKKGCILSFVGFDKFLGGTDSVRFWSFLAILGRVWPVQSENMNDCKISKKVFAGQLWTFFSRRLSQRWSSKELRPKSTETARNAKKTDILRVSQGFFYSNAIKKKPGLNWFNTAHRAHKQFNKFGMVAFIFLHCCCKAMIICGNIFIFHIRIKCTPFTQWWRMSGYIQIVKKSNNALYSFFSECFNLNLLTKELDRKMSLSRYSQWTYVDSSSILLAAGCLKSISRVIMRNPRRLIHF